MTSLTVIVPNWLFIPITIYIVLYVTHVALEAYAAWLTYKLSKRS